jgi:hypothetical protein
MCDGKSEYIVFWHEFDVKHYGVFVSSDTSSTVAIRVLGLLRGIVSHLIKAGFIEGIAIGESNRTKKKAKKRWKPY